MKYKKISVLVFAAISTASAAINLDFATDAVYVSGGTGARTVGAEYRFANVGTEDGIAVDAILTLGQLNGGAFYDNSNLAPNEGTTLNDRVVGISTNQGGDGVARISPSFDYTQFSFVEFNLRFVRNDNNAVGVGVTDLVLVASDIDSAPGQNITDVFFVDNSVVGTYQFDVNTLLVASSASSTSGINYLTFRQDPSVDLTSDGGILDSDAAQTLHSVLLSIPTITTSGINLGYGVAQGLGGNAGGLTDSPRRGLIDGSGNFVFDNPDVPVVVPEASSYAVLMGLCAVLFVGLRRR